MRRSLTLAVGAVVGVTVVGAVTPAALAWGGPGGTVRGTCTQVGPGLGSGIVAGGTLTAAQRATLVHMAEEEKLARDLYTALAARFPSLRQFSRIARSEATHLAAVRTLLTRYGIADPTVGKSAGTFSDPALQSLYDRLLAGATSPARALAAGVTVEKVDIADLARATEGVTAADVLRVYTNLSRGSQMHLRAFGG